MNKYIVILIAAGVLGGLWQNWGRIWKPSAAAVSGRGRVVMYATQRCGYCARMRAFFAEKGIAYEERDVDRSVQADEEFRDLDGHGVPLIVVDGKTVIRGYQPDAVLEALQ